MSKWNCITLTSLKQFSFVVTVFTVDKADTFLCVSSTVDSCLQMANMNVLWCTDYYRLVCDGHSIFGSALLLQAQRGRK